MKDTTEQLTVRYLEPSDWPAVREILVDFGNSKYAQYDSPQSTDDVSIREMVANWSERNREPWSENRQLTWLVCLEGEGGEVPIGYIVCFRHGNQYEIGYCFHSDYHRRGYASASIKDVLEFLRGRGITAILAGTALANTPSVELLKSLGFVQFGTERVSFWKDADGNDIYFDGGSFIYETDDYGCCGVHCRFCPDRESKNCHCRLAPIGSEDCPIVECCMNHRVLYCGECPDYPCADMTEFYEENEGHRRAKEWMDNINKL